MLITGNSENIPMSANNNCKLYVGTSLMLILKGDNYLHIRTEIKGLITYKCLFRKCSWIRTWMHKRKWEVKLFDGSSSTVSQLLVKEKGNSVLVRFCRWNEFQIGHTYYYYCHYHYYCYHYYYYYCCTCTYYFSTFLVLGAYQEIKSKNQESSPKNVWVSEVTLIFRF